MAAAACVDGMVEDQHSRKIVFFDVETTVPFRTGQKHDLLEFGAIVLDVQGLSELHSYNTLIRPSDLKSISRRSVECNGISQEMIAQAPTFVEVADEIFRILNGRIWAGHNIEKFDVLRIREAFSENLRQAPEPAGIIDTYPLLKKTFGRRAGNLRLATLANYCGYGEQKHRSLDDVRMNLDVLRSCATMMFLELNYPNIFPASWEHDPCSLKIQQSATVSVSEEQIRSRNDFPPNEDGLTLRLSESLLLGVPGSTEPRQSSQRNTKHSHVSFQMAKDGPSIVSEAITASALSSSLIDADEAGKVACSELKDHSSGDDPLKVYTLLSQLDLANIERASLEEIKPGYSEVASSNQKTEDPSRPWTGDNILVGPENARLEASIAEVGVDWNCDLSAALPSSLLSDMKDAMGADTFNISELEAQHLSLMVQTNDSELRIAAGPAKESFLLSSHVSLDLIELLDRSSYFGCKKALYYQRFPLQIWECKTRVRFTINPEYAIDDKGRPKFSILIEPSDRACEVFSKCEELVKGSMLAHDETARWLPLLRNERGVSGVRMSIETTGFGDSAKYITKFFQLTTNGVKEIALGKVDVAKFRYLVPHGSVIDVGFGFDVFAFNNLAGVKLLAKYITLR